LIHRMPWTAVLFLIACISISALPPFNGFISEWLIFQTALMAPNLDDSLLTTIIPFATAMLALAGALAATCFVKVFGVVFLGHARSESITDTKEVDSWMLIGMAIPALCCLLLGVLPALFLPLIDHVGQALLQTSLTESLQGQSWLWLAPINVQHASYSAPLALIGMLSLGGFIFWWLHPKGTSIRRSKMWSCGNPHTHARMQYNASSFSQPLLRIFSAFYEHHEHVNVEHSQHKLLTKHVTYAVDIEDRLVKYLYQPIGKMVRQLSRIVYREHQRDIHIYMTYSFCTILLLLIGFDIMQHLT